MTYFDESAKIARKPKVEFFQDVRHIVCFLKRYHTSKLVKKWSKYRKFTISVSHNLWLITLYMSIDRFFYAHNPIRRLFFHHKTCLLMQKWSRSHRISGRRRPLFAYCALGHFPSLCFGLEFISNENDCELQEEVKPGSLMASIVQNRERMRSEHLMISESKKRMKGEMWDNDSSDSDVVCSGVSGQLGKTVKKLKRKW